MAKRPEEYLDLAQAVKYNCYFFSLLYTMSASYLRALRFKPTAVTVTME